MHFRAFIFSLFLLICLAGCDQAPEQTYAPPTMGGKAYILTATDHIAVVDLATTALTRIKMDKKAIDLAIINKELYVLAADGTLATTKEGTTLTPWQPGAPSALAMTAAADNKSLWILAGKTVQQFIPGQGQGKTIPLDGDYSSLFVGGSTETPILWLIDSQKSTARPLDLTTAKTGTPIANIGNSIHGGLATAGSNELWLAEGNEYMNGKPYGVGYAPSGTPAMPGGVNVIDLKTGAQSDFIMVGGNVADLAIDPGHTKMYSATSQLPEYTESTLSLIDIKARRVTAELRLCEACHQEQNILLEKGQGKVLAVAVIWPEGGVR